MLKCHLLQPDTNRLVGDPVDVITGACLDVTTDFQLMGSVVLNWHRYYDSSHNQHNGMLGWGQTHEYDRRLEFDLDGISYVSPIEKPVGFPPFRKDKDQVSVAGYLLRRLSPTTFHLLQPGEPAQEFRYHPAWKCARLTSVFRGEDAIEFHYTNTGTLQKIVDSLKRSIRVQTDSQGRVQNMFLCQPKNTKDRLLIGYEYDKEGRIISGTDGHQGQFHISYDDDHRMVSKTDRLGYTFSFEYDEQGRCTYASGQDGCMGVSLRYHPEERMTLVTAHEGGDSRYYYDENRSLKLIIDPYGGTTAFVRDDSGKVIQEQAGNGAETKLVYDSNDRLLGKIIPSGEFVCEDPTTRDPRDHRVANCSLEWELGDLVARHLITLPANDDPVLDRVPSFARSYIKTIAHENIPQTVGTSGQWERATGTFHTGNGVFHFSDLGPAVKQSLPSGAIRTWSYDKNGNVVRYRSADGDAVRYEYRSWNLPYRRQDEEDRTIVCKFASNCDLTEIKDPGGVRHEYLFDQKQRLQKILLNGELQEEYEYDLDDHLVAKRNGKGETLISLEIGENGKKSVRRLASGENHYFDYDDQGRIIQAATDEHTTLFAYDHVGRRIQDKRDGLGVEHEFDCRGRGKTTLFGKFKVRYLRDKEGALVIEDPIGGKHRIQYLEHGLVVRTLSNGSVEVSQFDSEGRCLLKVHKGSTDATGAWSREYFYSPEGLLERAVDNQGGTTQYEHDSAGRLVRTKSVRKGTQVYRFDLADNLLEKPGLFSATLGEANRLRSANDEHIEYNDRGHISSRTTPSREIRYHYDSKDMLTECLWENGSRHVQYDPLGRRVSKTSGNNHVEYYWDTDRLAAEIAADGKLRIYVYADPFALTPLLIIDYESVGADPSSGSRYFLSSNHLGAPVLVENHWGEQVWQAALDPHGVAVVRPHSKIEMNLRFPGHYWDDETGLHYNRFRYYDPKSGRYIQSDPIGVAGGLNLYAYCKSPVSTVDVRGLTSECPPIERRIWSEEDLEEARKYINNVLQHKNAAQLMEMGSKPVRLTEGQAALRAALDDPANRVSGGYMYSPYSRVPLKGSVNARDLHALTQNTGKEHGVVRDSEGNLWITRGDDNRPGVNPENGEECLVHTHPHDTPPSPGDLQFAQGPAAVVGPDGRVTDYNQDGQDPFATQSPIASDGTIDGQSHAIEPIISEL